MTSPAWIRNQRAQARSRIYRFFVFWIGVGFALFGLYTFAASGFGGIL